MQYDMIGLLKMYLREMPEPLMTFELYDCFTAMYDPKISEEQRLEKVVPLFAGLPKEHVHCFLVFLPFFVSFAHIF